jgi:hypothetical protein
LGFRPLNKIQEENLLSLSSWAPIITLYTLGFAYCHHERNNRYSVTILLYYNTGVVVSHLLPKLVSTAEPMDPGDAMQAMHASHRSLLQVCQLRKPVLKNGSASDAECCCLHKLFSKYIDSLMVAFNTALPVAATDRRDSTRILSVALSQVAASVSLLLRHLNDSLSPLSRRSDEASLVLALLLHQDVCGLSEYLEIDVCGYFKRLCADMRTDDGVLDTDIMEEMIDVVAMIESKLLEVFPTIAINVENVIFLKIASAISTIMGATCGGRDYFLPKNGQELTVQLGESIEEGCLAPMLGATKHSGTVSLQRLVSVTVNSVLVG